MKEEIWLTLGPILVSNLGPQGNLFFKKPRQGSLERKDVPRFKPDVCFLLSFLPKGRRATKHFSSFPLFRGWPGCSFPFTGQTMIRKGEKRSGVRDHVFLSPNAFSY